MLGKNLIASPFRATFICFLSFNISSKGEFLQPGNAQSFCFCHFMIGFPMSFKMKFCAQKKPREPGNVVLFKGDGSRRQPSLLRFNSRLRLITGSLLSLLPSSTLHILPWPIELNHNDNNNTSSQSVSLISNLVCSVSSEGSCPPPWWFYTNPSKPGFNVTWN